MKVIDCDNPALMLVLSAEIESTNTFSNPVLFIKGGDSNYILPEHKAIIMALFPDSKAKIIQGAGHWLHAESPDIFYELVMSFLKKNHCS